MRQINIKINNKEITLYRVDNDINGNPRYVIHYLAISYDYDDALKISRKIGGKIYRAKWFGGGIVFQSYSLFDDLKQIIK